MAMISPRNLALVSSVLMLTACQNYSKSEKNQEFGNKIHFIDLTHEIPTFNPEISDKMKPDLNDPYFGSKPIAGFGPQAILYPPDVFRTSDGYFNSRSLLLQEHAGTHVNAPNHYVNNSTSLEPGGIPNDARHSINEIPISQLTGPIVLIDIAARVRAELNKNGGRPSKNVAITDFSDQSMATVRAADVDRIADQLQDGTWLIANTGWSKFFSGAGEDWDSSPFVNGMNHPGFTREAIDRLITIMDKKHIRLAGIASDSFTGDSGESARGRDDAYTDAWPAHVRLYQRNVLIVESLDNVGELASAIGRGEHCFVVVGALKHVGGTGSPARVVGMCQ